MGVTKIVFSIVLDSKMRLFIWSFAILAISAETQANQPATAEQNNVQAVKSEQDNAVQSQTPQERFRRWCGNSLIFWRRHKKTAFWRGYWKGRGVGYTRG